MPPHPADFPAIRPSKFWRMYLLAFLTVWCGGVLFAAVKSASKGSPTVFFLVIMLAFGVTIGVRTWRRSVIFGADALIVRNFFHTRSLHREEIEGFRLGSISNQPFNRAIYALLRDGSVFPLDVTGRLAAFGRGLGKFEQRQALLQAWLDQDR
jgi:hypothetical protein